MSKPIFEDLCELKGRRNRLSFFLAYLVFPMIILMILIPMLLFHESIVYSVLLIPFFFACVASTIILITMQAQRCRDFGWTGWAVLLTLIPFLGSIFWLALFLIPGTNGENRYGPDPLKKK